MNKPASPSSRITKQRAVRKQAERQPVVAQRPTDFDFGVALCIVECSALRGRGTLRLPVENAVPGSVKPPAQRTRPGLTRQRRDA